ncbi:MAG: hypothetical protein JOY64_28080 [Alphaproteobacteria bacterium]|nr:hypothetical protein [Alphaproteobacteria bacterium]MBV8411518.1 hypothetical protein [Alphaproteobacteria bacterium]
MRYLGVMRGEGHLACGGEPIGRAAYEIDGFQTRGGDVVGSGEIRMDAWELHRALGRKELSLTTDEGRVLEVRFSSRRSDGRTTAAHADIGGDLPPVEQWTR